MPLILAAIVAAPVSLWLVNREVEKTIDITMKLAVVGAVAYVAYVNRASIAKLVK